MNREKCAIFIDFLGQIDYTVFHIYMTLLKNNSKHNRSVQQAEDCSELLPQKKKE